MKSIKEKSKEYGLLNPDIYYDADGNTYDDTDKPSMDFEAGANYVIAEFERALCSNGISRLKIAVIKDIINLLKEK